ncbi:MAG: WD40 repeat domain-containing protein [Anaerolineae bacterium]|nr:WD40 repeat domain-containing protein [Anaerolineae bacterium]
MVVTAEESAPAFACAEEDCQRLAWLPPGAGVHVIGEVEGRELDGNTLWYEVSLDCPCFDYEHRFLDNSPTLPVSAEGTWTLWQPRWSSDGSRIAAVAGTDLFVWDSASGNVLTQESYAPFTLLPPSWSPDGAEMVLAGLDQEGQKSLLLLLDANGQSLRPLNGHEGWTLRAAWSPDGSRIAAVGDQLRIWDAQRGHSLLAIETFAIAFHWSPDGERIVTINHRDEAAQVRDASSAELLFELGGESAGQLPWLDWSPDGARLVTFDVLVGTIHVWDARDGHRLASLAEDGSRYVFGADWSPDGAYIFYVLTGDLSGQIRRWNGKEQDPPLTLFDSDQGILDFSLSPDGHFLAAGIEGKVRILETSEGRLLSTLSPPDTETQERFSGHVSWSPDGKRVAAADSLYGRRSPVGRRNTVASVWDLTLIPEGMTHAFIHSSLLGNAAPGDG